jgi:hypothetical protein
MIDIVYALDLLDTWVCRHGSDYRSAHRAQAARTRTGRPSYHACRDTTDSIAISGLTHIGTPSLRTPNLTLGAVVVLRAAASVQRQGGTCGASRNAGLRAAARFVELIPDHLIGSAAAGEARLGPMHERAHKDPQPNRSTAPGAETDARSTTRQDIA